MPKWILFYFLLLPGSTVSLAASESPQSQAVELAVSTLARQNNTAIDNIQVDSVEAVQWPDSSLGCPQPGMMYAQVITQGFRVTLLDLLKGSSYFVHVGKGKAVVCDKSASTRTQTEKNLRFGQRWQQSQQAQKLLAERLSVAPDNIRITGSKSFPTDKLPGACQAEKGITHATVIELSYQGKPYRFAIFGERLYFCD